MKEQLCFVVLTALILIACGSNPQFPQPEKTRVIGQVFRAPTEPVCVADIPCEAPFAASFHLFRDGVEMLTFQTGESGTFQLEVFPGEYIIEPGEDAPIWPRDQAKRITVPVETVVTIRLDYDTGIR